MFIAGMTGVAGPLVNDIWTVPGEMDMLKEWVKQDVVSKYSCKFSLLQIKE
jgi:UDP-N-acetyl-2-amino-2-deoxyglucuronate dehydrogenase